MVVVDRPCQTVVGIANVSTLNTAFYCVHKIQCVPWPIAEPRFQMDKCLQQTCHSVQTRLACRKQFAGSRFLRAAAPQRFHHAKRTCYAGMGLGFTDGLILPRSSEPKLEVPTNSYGLSTRQMAALGLTEDSVAKPLEANEVQA